MSAEQRVTDDVLDHWASEAKKESPGKLGSINLPAVVEMLIAEVRASRAREARLMAITYASDDGTEHAHTHRRGEGEPECPACWVHGIRAALVKD